MILGLGKENGVFHTLPKTNNQIIDCLKIACKIIKCVVFKMSCELKNNYIATSNYKCFWKLNYKFN